MDANGRLGGGAYETGVLISLKGNLYQSLYAVDDRFAGQGTKIRDWTTLISMQTRRGTPSAARFALNIAPDRSKGPKAATQSVAKIWLNVPLGRSAAEAFAASGW